METSGYIKAAGIFSTERTGHIFLQHSIIEDGKWKVYADLDLDLDWFG